MNPDIDKLITEALAIEGCGIASSAISLRLLLAEAVILTILVKLD